MDSYKNLTGHRYQCILCKYRTIFPRWLHLMHISDGFSFFSLLSAGRPSPCSDRLWEFRPVRMRDDIIGLFLVTAIWPWHPGKDPLHFKFAISNISVIPVYFKLSF